MDRWTAEVGVANRHWERPLQLVEAVDAQQPIPGAAIALFPSLLSSLSFPSLNWRHARIGAALSGGECDFPLARASPSIPRARLAGELLSPCALFSLSFSWAGIALRFFSPCASAFPLLRRPHDTLVTTCHLRRYHTQQGHGGHDALIRIAPDT